MKKIYVGNRKLDLEGFQSVSDVEMLNYIAADAECVTIILDGYLRGNHFNYIENIIAFCLQKLRMGGVLKIVDIDFDLLCSAYQKNHNIQDLQVIFNKPISSFVTIELVKNILEKSGRVVQSGAVINGIEFDTEFTRVS